MKLSVHTRRAYLDNTARDVASRCSTGTAGLDLRKIKPNVFFITDPIQVVSWDNTRHDQYAVHVFMQFRLRTNDGGKAWHLWVGKLSDGRYYTCWGFPCHEDMPIVVIYTSKVSYILDFIRDLRERNTTKVFHDVNLTEAIRMLTDAFLEARRCDEAARKIQRGCSSWLDKPICDDGSIGIGARLGLRDYIV